MAKKGNYKIPFDLKGNLLDYVYKYNLTNVVMEDNYQFKDTLKYSGYSKGRSSAHIHFKSTTNNRGYHMTLKDFDKVINNNMFVDNQVTGDFTFAKRGANYMLVPIILNEKQELDEDYEDDDLP